MGQKLKVAAWISMGVVAGALATVSMQTVAQGMFSPLPLKELQQFAAVYSIIKSDYVKPVDEGKLVTDAISGMVSSLDPHSQYFDKKAFKAFREGTSGKFVGVGIEITMEDGLVKVVSPIEGSPAFRAGMTSGDLITRIDDTAVRDLTLDQAVKRMRGEPNTKVVLTVFRKSENRTFPVTIVREEIRVQSVRAKMMEPGYAWIRLSQFQDRTVEDFVRKVNELYQEDPDIKGIVLDMRNDPGGLLTSAVAIAAAFLPEGSVVVTTNGQLESSKMVFKATPSDYLTPPMHDDKNGGVATNIKRMLGDTPDPLQDLPAVLKKVPLVVLVNEGSASASEIVAGALQDHKRAIVMGRQTFGKGSVQTVRPIGPEAGIKLTTSLYYTPDGTSIQAKGIVPDIWLDETVEGNPYAALRTREADLSKHLESVTVPEDKEAEKVREKAREEAREEAIRKLEERAKKSDDHVKPPPQFGAPEDFPLQQALNKLRGLPVTESKNVEERPEKKENTGDDDAAADQQAAPPPPKEEGQGTKENTAPVAP